MEYAAHVPSLPSRKSMVAPVAALLIGAGIATGAYALIDDNPVSSPGKVIVVEQPAQGSAQIPGKNEAATAAAIGSTAPSVTQVGKDEASTAAAIGTDSPAVTPNQAKDEAAIASSISSTDSPAVTPNQAKDEAAIASSISSTGSQSGGVQLRGSKASSTGTSSSSTSQSADSGNVPFGPHSN
jgi:hypothetical protein